MALGYENTGIGPKLIANAGNAMTESIRQFGEKLQKDIVAHNTDKQVMGFLSEAKTLNLDSPTFQGDLVGVLAKYPMAAGDQRALMGAKLLATGWEQKQAEKTAVTRFNERKTLAGMRSGGGGLYGGDGFNPDLPALPETGESAAFDAGGEVLGAMSPLGVPFAPQTEVPTTDEANPLFNQDLDQTFRRIGVDRRTGTRLMAQDAAAKAREGRKPAKPTTRQVAGVGLVQYNPDDGVWETVVDAGQKPSRWLNTGAAWRNADTGEEVAISASESQKSAAQARTAADEDRDKNRQLGILKTKIADIKDRRKTMFAAYEKSRKAGSTAEADLQYREVQAMDSVIKDLESGMDKVEATEKVKVVAPNGTVGFVPKSQVDTALKNGYQLAP